MRSASAIAAADLPLAVGPAIRMTRFSGIRMPVTAITLVCNPETEALDDDIVEEAMHRLLEAFDGEVMRRTLADGEAEDILVEGDASRREIERILAGLLVERPVDLVVQPAQFRRKKLLIADMDSTIIGQECIDELADFAGCKTEISAITERAMRGEIDFEAALKERVGMLAGLSESVLDECFQERIRLNPGATALVRTMNASGATTVLVSGGFTFFVERVAKLAGFAHFLANELLIEGDALSGRVREPILGREAKEAALRSFAAASHTPLQETVAVGDGANDLDMIAAAGLGVAYRAKPKVAEAADASIRHGDLTALLYAQGYARDDFAF
jgi:phosphoserine phosphatase